MQKKALVMAVGAALLIPAVAFAQRGGGKAEGPEPDSVVELYGKVYPELVMPSSSGATTASADTGATSSSYCTICTRPSADGSNAFVKRTEMESSNSRFGVRGSERLGGDLRAIFQLETQFLVDQNNTPFAARDSFVGLQHKLWGTIKLGRMDTPFKEYGDDISFLGVSSGNFTSTSNVYRQVGFGGVSGNSRFHERRVNVVQYESPKVGPADFKVQWSTNEAKTDVAPLRDPRVLSMGGRFELPGNFALLLGHEIHWDLFGLSSSGPSAFRNTTDPNVRSKDKATAVALTWKPGMHEFEIDGNQIQFDEPGATVAGRLRSYKQNHYLFTWQAKWTKNFRTQVQYVRATQGTCSRVLADCNTNGLKGEQFGVGFAYYFSPRTYLFMMATLLKNDFAANYNNSAAQAPNPGEDIKLVGLGLHTAW